MIFLTYHQISLLDAADFYTVPVRFLQDHLTVLCRKTFTCGTVNDLVAGRAKTTDYFMTFDDGTSDHIEIVAPLLEKRGMKAIFFVPTAKLGQAGRLSREQVVELAKRGHEIGCHSHEHRRLDTLSASEIREQLRVSSDILSELTGQKTQILAPPGGYTSPMVQKIAVELGMPLVRTMKWGINRSPVLNDLETIALNRKFPVAKLEKILDGRGLLPFKMLYAAKQTAKALFPLRLYECVRNAMFRR
jgi:peptidoglycan/xylan/chitin deacetylase (PgdA/CDA1 family)